MDAAVWGFVGVVVGGLITGLVSIRLESIRADKAAALDSAKREDDRRLDRDNFQRATLVELQDLGDGLSKLLALVRERAATGFQTSAAWNLGLLGPDIAESVGSYAARLVTLKSRIADPEARDLVTRLGSVIWAFAAAQDAAAVDRAQDELHAVLPRLLERSGELLLATFRTD